MAFLKPDKVETWNGVKVNVYPLEKHNPRHIDMPYGKLPNNKPRFITLHNTSWINTASGTTPAEQYLRATQNGNMKTVRVHFYVDNVCAWQGLDLASTSWHSGDGTGPQSGNIQSISIECIMKGENDSVSRKSEDNAAKLIAYLLKKYDLTVEKHLVTHTYWISKMRGLSGNIDYLNTAKGGYKWCPAYILPHWDSFKKKVQSYLDKLNGTVKKEEKDEINVETQMYRIRKTWADTKSQIGAFSSLENAKKAWKEGYSIFDNNGKKVYPVTNSKPSNASVGNKPDVYYKVYGNKKWSPEIKNYNTTNDKGYAGTQKQGINGLCAKTSKGTLKYRVHLKNGGWLSWISKYDSNNWNTGCAGLKNREIDGIQFKLEGVEGYEAKYRVSTIKSGSYLPWVVGTEDYAGIFKQTIDCVQVEIVRN